MKSSQPEPCSTEQPLMLEADASRVEPVLNPHRKSRDSYWEDDLLRYATKMVKEREVAESDEEYGRPLVLSDF